MRMRHITVFKEEVVTALHPKPGAVIVDCTLGSGGHAEAILPHIGSEGVYLGIDADPTALETTRRYLDGTGGEQVQYICDTFAHLPEILANQQIEQVDGIVADLGWRIEQFNGDSGVPRGFSFSADEPLLMTYGDPDTYSFTAADIVNEWREEDIANVLFAYGQERFSRRIARAIVEARQDSSIETARELGELIKDSVPHWYASGRTHPATKSFQALRIAVNDEFDTLTTLIQTGFAALAPGGRMAIITFHSLEDRIVKEHFKTFARDALGVLVTKKPLSPDAHTIKNNPRARSAKLRTIEKI